MNSMHPVSLFKKVLPQESWGRSVRNVAVGDRYEQRDVPVSFWVVERISQVQMSQFPLVRLSRVGYPDITKTVSLSALSEENEYRFTV